MASNGADRAGKLLVVYYSLSGNTARVAWDIAKLTEGDVESLRDPCHGAGFFGLMKAALDAVCGRSVKLGDVRYDPREYSLVIIGTPVWVGRMTPAIRTYLQRFAKDLPHVGFFVTAGKTDAERIVPSVERILSHTVDASTGFNTGELDDSRVYDAKIGRFLETLHRSPVIRTRAPESACCL
jgi:hypothetical protein